MLESEIENYLVKQVEAAGGEVRKLQWIGRRGAPDRLVMLNGAHFVELKRPGRKLDAHQGREFVKMIVQGVDVVKLDNKEDVDNFVKELVKGIY